MLFERFALPRSGEADGEGEGLGGVLRIIGGELIMDAGEDDFRGGSIDLGQDDGELVTAVAADDVFGAEGLREQAGGVDDAFVAGLVAVLLIETFQAIDLGGEDGDGEAARLFEAGELGLEEEAVIEAGEGIVGGEEGDVLAGVGFALEGLPEQVGLAAHGAHGGSEDVGADDADREPDEGREQGLPDRAEVDGWHDGAGSGEDIEPDKDGDDEDERHQAVGAVEEEDGEEDEEHHPHGAGDIISGAAEEIGLEGDGQQDAEQDEAGGGAHAPFADEGEGG